MQGMTMSHGIVNSLPGIGSGLRRPLASGGPRRVRWKVMPATLPSFSTTSTGEEKNSNCTPSKRVSCCSSSSTTISSGPRR